VTVEGVRCLGNEKFAMATCSTFPRISGSAILTAAADETLACGGVRVRLTASTHSMEITQ
jgi:hypothetical protein